MLFLSILIPFSQLLFCDFFFLVDFPEIFKEKASARIVNGFETKEPLPYQLQLVASEEEFLEDYGIGEYYCGAVLIRPNYAVTAYHCFSLIKDIENGHRGKKWPADKKILDFISVVAGSYLRNEKNTPPEFKIQVISNVFQTKKF